MAKYRKVLQCKDCGYKIMWYEDDKNTTTYKEYVNCKKCDGQTELFVEKNMRYRVGDKVRVQRGFFIVTCEIIEIDESNEHPYLVRGYGTKGRTSDNYILGLHEGEGV